MPTPSIDKCQHCDWGRLRPPLEQKDIAVCVLLHHALAYYVNSAIRACSTVWKVFTLRVISCRQVLGASLLHVISVTLNQNIVLIAFARALKCFNFSGRC